MDIAYDVIQITRKQPCYRLSIYSTGGTCDGLTVLQDTSIRNIDPLPLVRNNYAARVSIKFVSNTRRTDHGATQSDIPAKVDIACDRQVVKLDDRRDPLEPLLELSNLQRRCQRSDPGVTSTLEQNTKAPS